MISSKWFSIHRDGYSARRQYHLRLFKLMINIRLERSFCLYVDPDYDTLKPRLQAGLGLVHFMFFMQDNGQEDPSWSYQDWKYGFATHHNGIYLHWKNWMGAWDLPFVNWTHELSEYQDHEGKWQPEPSIAEQIWGDKSDQGRPEPHQEEHPVFYELRSGKIQWRVATCSLRRMTWHLKWWPWKKMVRTSMDVKFNDEVGEQTGSWKGGVTGCGHDIKPGETIPECLDRMLAERDF